MDPNISYNPEDINRSYPVTPQDSAKASEMESQLDILKENCLNLEREVNEIGSDMTILYNKMSILENEISNTESQLQKLKENPNRFPGTKREIARLEDDIKTHAERLPRYKKKYDALYQNNVIKMVDLTNTKIAIEQLEKELQNFPSNPIPQISSLKVKESGSDIQKSHDVIPAPSFLKKMADSMKKSKKTEEHPVLSSKGLDILKPKSSTAESKDSLDVNAKQKEIQKM